uniref:Uncharacterized protein n=1 Tax=viral metagenome TaxID=1070528 RepID=A0A6M3IDN6_9ZZZZ
MKPNTTKGRMTDPNAEIEASLATEVKASPKGQDETDEERVARLVAEKVKSGAFISADIFGKENLYDVQEKYRAGGQLRPRWVASDEARIHDMMTNRGYRKPSDLGIPGLEDQQRGGNVLMLCPEGHARRYESWVVEEAKKQVTEARSDRGDGEYQASEPEFVPSKKRVRRQ